MVKIYAIECIVTGKAYVGCTKGKLNKRMREHRCLLNKGVHTADELLVDWRKYGEKSFEAKVLEEVEPILEKKREAELRWMKIYSCEGKLYNRHETSFAPPLGAQAKAQKLVSQIKRDHPERWWNDEANEKRRKARLGKPHTYGDKISEGKRKAKLRRLMEQVKR